MIQLSLLCSFREEAKKTGTSPSWLASNMETPLYGRESYGKGRGRKAPELSRVVSDLILG
jgi:hypothetical protein